MWTTGKERGVEMQAYLEVAVHLGNADPQSNDTGWHQASSSQAPPCFGCSAAEVLLMCRPAPYQKLTLSA